MKKYNFWLLKLIPAIVSFIISIEYCHAQSEMIDSMKNDIHHYTKKDSILVKKMISLATAVSDINSDTAVIIINNAIQLSNKLQWSKGILNLLMMRGRIFSGEEAFDAAIADFLSAQKIAEKNSLELDLCLCPTRKKF